MEHLKTMVKRDEATGHRTTLTFEFSPEDGMLHVLQDGQKFGVARQASTKAEAWAICEELRPSYEAEGFSDQKPLFR